MTCRAVQIKNTETHAGIIIPNGKIASKYYTADIDIFIDEVKPTFKSYKEWLDEFGGVQSDFVNS